MHKILKIVAAIVGVLGIVFLVRIISAGDDAIKSGEKAGLVDPMAYVAYAILAAAVVAVVIFIFRNILINPSGLKNTLIGVGAFAAVLLVSYFVLATGEDESFKLGLYKSGDEMATAGQSKLVGGGLIAFYILIVVAAISMIFSGVKKVLSK
ncbi:hypothetical protein DFQ05_2276 [Winogradskyella wandonensis]|uniref:Uncharacterized protein n=1 Tax=Winogradskyella wandonensis TaxID=1442586 RepID=A0A4R1KLA3_9FLAO|nr:hypothetical protein [Winogradskyella wandonensis]TCK65063.1 hypothetical protein DFQ05_2276 [Winogradskyella wandonensis]